MLPLSILVEVLFFVMRSINVLNFLSKHPIQRNTWNQIFKTLRYQEQMILSSSMYEKTYLQVPLKELLKLFKCLASSGIHMVSAWLDLLFKALHQERKRKNERILIRITWAPWVMVILPLFIDIWYVDYLYIKIIIIMSISTNIHRPYLCNPSRSIYLTRTNKILVFNLN